MSNYCFKITTKSMQNSCLSSLCILDLRVADLISVFVSWCIIYINIFHFFMHIGYIHANYKISLWLRKGWLIVAEIILPKGSLFISMLSQFSLCLWFPFLCRHTHPLCVCLPFEGVSLVSSSHSAVLSFSIKVLQVQLRGGLTVLNM